MKKKPLSLWVSMLILALTGVAWAEMVAHVNFNGSTEDVTGKGHDGTPTNLTFGPGKFGLAMVDDGTGYVTLAPDAGTDIQIGGHDCTIAAWINTTSTQAMTILMKTNPANGGTHEAQDRTFGVGYTAGHVGMDNGWVGSFHGTTLVNDGVWHHVAWTQTQAAAGATAMWTLYVDGQSEGTNTAMVPQADPASHQITIAKGLSSTIFPNTWTGSIDDVRIYNNALTQDEIAAVMSEGDGGSPGAARYPGPADMSIDVPGDTALSWTAGQYAASHDVYLGTAFDDVNNASRTAPQGVLASQGQAATTFAPAGFLTFGQTYYWRVDEVNAAPDSSIYKGSVWSFTAEPYGYLVKPMKATASTSMAATMGPEKTIDGSGLDSLDQHGISATSMWTSKKGQTPIWIQYEFDKAYKLYQMWVWNSNQAVEQSVGFGAQDVTVETSLDGTAWTALADVPKFNQATGEPNYVHNTTVDFAGAQAKFVKLTITSNWADSNKQASLSEVRFFYVPVKAFSPGPANGAVDVAVGTTLNWRPGREAASHTLYISADADAAANGTVAPKTMTGHRYDVTGLNLDYGKTYYWRVDEVNDAAATELWQGEVWSFTTIAYAVVDNFDGYDNACNRIFFAWVDGFGYSAAADCGMAAASGNGTGSTVGNATTPFAEKTITRSGSSMPFWYDNTKSPFYSEATRTWSAGTNWTGGGVNTLVAYVRGDAPAFFETTPGTLVMNGMGTDIWDASDQFRFVYKTLKGNGSIVAKVESVSNPHEWAKAGVMIRESVSSGSMHATVAATPTATHGVSLQWRNTPDTATNLNADVADTPLPQWVKLTRNGSSFTAQRSADGKTWVDITPTTACTIDMASDVLIGLAVSSHTAGAIASAKFSSVSTTGTVSGSWTMAEIGATQATGNVPETFYVSVTDKAGKSATFLHPDTTVICTGSWQEVQIPLSQFAGVNMGTVQKLTLGVGDPTAPKAGNSGKIYIDDIRLVRK